MLFMGIDVGSSGCKASVIDATGAVVCFASREYSFTYSAAGCELDAQTVFDKVCECILQLATEQDLSALKTVSVTSFGEMFVLLDGEKRVLAPSISYEDTRGTEELAALTACLGEDRLYQITGAIPSVMYALPKLLWTRKHRREAYEKAKYLCMFADFILMKLGAEHHTDYSLAARTLLFDVNAKCWSREIADAVALDLSLFGKPLPSGSRVGVLSPSMAEALALPPDVLLLAGGHDQPCAALGAGIIRAGGALDGMGSNECIVPAFDRAMLHGKMKAANLVCVPHIVPGLFVTYAFNRTAGSLFKWYNAMVGGVGFARLVEEMSDEPTGLFVLPHFAGAATPYMDEGAVGAILGLKLSTDRAELTRAVLEGLNYEMLVNLKCLDAAGFRVERLFAAGGMSKDDRSLQLKADMLGIPVFRLKNAEPGTLGTAILGGVAVGLYRDLAEAAEALVQTEKVFYPNGELHEKYKELFTKYENLYHSVKAFYEK